MSYTPNWTHRSTRRRIRHALGFVRACFNETKPMSWSTRYIDRHLGQQQKEISKYLRKQLIRVVDDKYQFGSQGHKCKTYVLNREGYDRVLARYLGKEVDDHSIDNSLTNIPLLYTFSNESEALAREWITNEFREELSSLTFEYELKSHRLWHPMQNVRSDYRRSVMADHGFRWEYDIECAAPTLIQQYARHLGEDAAMPFLDTYLRDRKVIRAKLAVEAELNPDVVKRIINALFCGAHLAVRDDSSVYQLLDCDASRVEFLREHEFIRGLRADIKKSWDMIKYFMPRRTIICKNGRSMTLPIKAGQKWYEYFRLERQVMDSVRDYLDRMGNKYFLEHDGWRSIERVDVNDLSDWVYQHTCFRLKFEELICD